MSNLKQLVEQNLTLARSLEAGLELIDRALTDVPRKLPKPSANPETQIKYTIVYYDRVAEEGRTDFVIARDADHARDIIEGINPGNQVVAVFRGEHVNQID